MNSTIPLLFALAVCGAQTPQPAQRETAPTEFEVAAIKTYVQPPPQAGRKGGLSLGMHGGPGTDDPGQITWNGALKSLITSAYNVKKYQVAGPSWLDTERFTIAAKVARGATKEHVLVMWQNLLVQRFQLKFHRESREVPVYEITIAKNGPKLKESPPDRPPDAEPTVAVPLAHTGRLTTEADGCPVLPDGRIAPSMRMLPGRYQICAHKMTIEFLVSILSGYVDRPIFDKTGLSGKYDFDLEFLPGSSTGVMAEQEAWPPIFATLQVQLGLKLDLKKAPADILIIDSIEKTPTEN